MRRSTTAFCTLVLATATAWVPGPAAAAGTDFGNGCLNENANGNLTVVMVAGSTSNPLPVAAPTTGVITKARVAMPATPNTFPERLKLLRPAAAPNQYTVVAESSLVVVVGGVQTYDVRVPVQAGDLLGMSGDGGAFSCNTGISADKLASTTGDQRLGSTATYFAASGYALPVVATIEPDLDADGFGDLTQDLCPKSASLQSACPSIALDSVALARGGSITVYVGTDSSGEVTVSGSARVHGRTVELKGGTKVVTPGDLGKFKVKLPKALQKALAALPPSKRIKVTLTSAATDDAGLTAVDRTSVRLPGTRQP